MKCPFCTKKTFLGYNRAYLKHIDSHGKSANLLSSNIKSNSELDNFKNNHNDISILHLNINSVTCHLSELNDIISKNQFDIILLCETKLDNSTPFNVFNNSNYQLIRRDRSSRGGGLLVFIKKTIHHLERKKL